MLGFVGNVVASLSLLPCAKHFVRFIIKVNVSRLSHSLDLWLGLCE